MCVCNVIILSSMAYVYVFVCAELGCEGLSLSTTSLPSPPPMKNLLPSLSSVNTMQKSVLNAFALKYSEQINSHFPSL